MDHKSTPHNLHKWLKDQNRETLIMGIVNVTPDSFSDGGKYNTLESAFDHSLKLVEEGADIIDVGGESSRPGSSSITLNEELDRTLPLIIKIRTNFPDIIISIDTTKSRVAEQAILSGANIINDISGLSNDKNMAKVAFKYNVSVVIMHMQGNPKTMQNNPSYSDLIGQIKIFFEDQIQLATNTGIQKDRIILDPGIGFGKSFEDNFKLINQLDKFCKLGFPILIGPSRKSFIGLALNEGIENRLEGTAAAVTSGIIRGARIVRVHDVKQIKKVVKITELIRIA